MPPAISFTKENIIDAAFEVYNEIGIEKITIRKIANKLGSSIAPIYSNFKNLNEVRMCVMEKTLKILLGYTEKEYSNNTFLNVGIGLLKFARENKVLYKTLFIHSNEYSYLIDEFFSRNLEQMKKEKTLQDLSEAEMRRILEKVRLFTHGLAAFICSGNMQDKSDDDLYEMLKEVGEDVTGYTIYKKKSKGFMK